MHPLTNPRGITIRQLKELIKDLPEVNADGEEFEVWMNVSADEDNIGSYVCKSIYKLNDGDIILDID